MKRLEGNLKVAMKKAAKMLGWGGNWRADRLNPLALSSVAQI